MLSGVCVGTNDLDKVKTFYDRVLATIHMKRVVTEQHELGYASDDGRVTFWVVTPYNEKPASFGNGTQVMFETPDKASVHAFYDTAIECGGSDEGKPGPRDYSPTYYGAYCRDLDGNKLHVSVQSY